ncbi:O-antigen ligase family protein, partial [Candidatus Auribacterota bacterium]
ERCQRYSGNPDFDCMHYISQEGFILSRFRTTPWDVFEKRLIKGQYTAEQAEAIYYTFYKHDRASTKIVKGDFLSIQLDRDRLWNRLIEKKYINRNGVIQNKFRNLSGAFNPEEFKASAFYREVFKFWYTPVEKARIYAVLKRKFSNKSRYLGCSLVGIHESGITAFAYNRGYLAQYLIVILPFILYYLFPKWRSKRIVFVLASCSLLIVVFTLPLTKQRAAILAFLVQLIILFIFVLMSIKKKKKIMLISIIVLFLSIFFLFMADHFIRGGMLYKRLVHTKNNPGLRPKQWSVALKMAEMNPLLGVGLGKYHHFFPKYCQMNDVDWNDLRYGIRLTRTTAHNLYLHILAEQGILGLLSFLAIIGVIFRDVFKSLKLMNPDEKTVTIILFISLAGWLAYGMTQQ